MLACIYTGLLINIFVCQPDARWLAELVTVVIILSGALGKWFLHLPSIPRVQVGDRLIPWIGVFRYCRMTRATLSLSKEPCFHSLSSSRFSLRVLLSHWTRRVRLRIVYASHAMFEGIFGICWRWEAAHRRYWVHLGCRMFGTVADRWTSIWIMWHDLLLGGTRWANQLVYLHIICK